MGFDRPGSPPPGALRPAGLTVPLGAIPAPAPDIQKAALLNPEAFQVQIFLSLQWIMSQ